MYWLLLLIALFSSKAFAQDCDGSPEFCHEFIQMNDKLRHTEVALSEVTHQKDLIVDEAQAQINMAVEEVGTKTAKMAAIAAAIAVFLRSVLSFLKSIEKIPDTPKGKAWMKLSTLLVGFLIFVASNLGVGMPWWQALILAGGGPGSILVNELAKAWPILFGRPTQVQTDSSEET